MEDKKENQRAGKAAGQMNQRKDKQQQINSVNGSRVEGKYVVVVSHKAGEMLD